MSGTAGAEARSSRAGTPAVVAGKHDAYGVFAIATTPSGDLLASGDDSSVSVFAMPEVCRSGSFGRKEGGTCWCLMAMPSGDRVLCALSGGTIRMESLVAATAAPLHVYRGHSRDAYAVALVTAATFASASADKTVRLWDADRDEATATLSGHSLRVLDIAKLDDHVLVSSSSDKTAALWDTRTASRTAAIAIGNAAHRLTPLRGGVIVAMGLNSGGVALWDLRASRKVSLLRGHLNRVYGVAQLPDGRLASSSDDRTVRIWDVAEQRSVGVITAPSLLSRCCVTADGRLAVASWSCKVYVYDVASATECL